MNTILKPLCVSGLLSVMVFNSPAGEKVIQSGIAGTWYPDNPDVLKEQLQKFFKSAKKPETKGDIISLILPHAGYDYSGQTAASGINQLTKKYKTIIIIGPSHNVGMKNTYSVPVFDSYETPLGKVTSDSALISKLLKNPVFKNIPEALTPEHSVQMEVPLLQYALKDFKLVFIVAGQCDYETVAKAGKEISSLMSDDTLIVTSSDFIHCGARFRYIPFDKNTPENVKKIDMEAYALIEKKDAKSFMAFIEKSGATICGAVPIATILSALPENAVANLVEYTDSGIVTGDRSNTVSYVAAAFTGEWKKMEKSTDEGLPEVDRKTLLSLARKTIGYYLKNEKVPSPEDLDIKITDAMKQQRAAFVTLKKNGRLRGCIGEIFPSQPLYKSIISNAINAAVEDPRFPNVTANELPDISIEISALTVPKEVESYKDIKIGRDGMVLTKGGPRAVFLPQVAPEQGWDLDETLTNLAMKAGLSPDAWKQGCKFLTFQAEVFGEKEGK